MTPAHSLLASPAIPRDWQSVFLEFLPAIRRHLSYCFRQLRGEARDEYLQEGLCNCAVRLAQLACHGNLQVATPTSLARFAVAQIRSGRRIAEKLNVRNPLSRYCQIRKGIEVESLHHWDADEDGWVDVVVASHQTPVPDQVALRVDIPQWLQRFAERTRQIARDMALGWTTSELAARYGLSPSRISQMRREFYASWQEFQGNWASTTAAVLASQ